MKALLVPLKDLNEAADALEALAGEVAQLKSDNSTLKREMKHAIEEVGRMYSVRDRLKAALSKKLSAKAREKLGEFSESMIAMGDGHSLEMLLNWYDESRKALGGDA